MCSSVFLGASHTAAVLEVDVSARVCLGGMKVAIRAARAWQIHETGGEVDDGARYPIRVTPEQEQRLGPFDLTDEIGASIGAKGNAVDRTLPRDPAAAEPLARSSSMQRNSKDAASIKATPCTTWA